jgi:hypothetical protein
VSTCWPLVTVVLLASSWGCSEVAAGGSKAQQELAGESVYFVIVSGLYDVVGGWVGCSPLLTLL